MRAQPPFALLSDSAAGAWLSQAKLIQLRPGQKLISPTQLQDRIYLVVRGLMRFLAEIDSGDEVTLELRGSGQFLGWVSLLRAEACETVIASEETLVLALPAQGFLDGVSSNPAFADWFGTKAHSHEAFRVARAALAQQPQQPGNWVELLMAQWPKALVVSIRPGEPFEPPAQAPADYDWYVSTAQLPGVAVGQSLWMGDVLPDRPGFGLNYRCVGLPRFDAVPMHSEQLPSGLADLAESLELPLPAVSLEQLGILEDDNLEDDQRFPLVRGQGTLQEALAVCEMTALQQQVPFRRDGIQKVLEDQFRRDKTLSLELLAALTELIGLNSQLGEVDSRYLGSLEAPALLMLEGSPVMVFAIQAKQAVLGHPRRGLQRIPLTDLQQSLGEQVRFVLPRRIASTPTSRFGWSWFTPLLGKYRGALILVFAASLLAQLFGLAIPLLIQQIIDKVLSQGNLSSLNVLGTLMVVLAIFQGLLMALRTYIFVDTTDRMDLTLGSAVIDRLLALPLPFFDKRPVGELSQRLGELNTIRGFLTGTALVSVLNIVFAALYLVVMVLYSPLLTVVALSTLPLYLLLVFGVAPLYRHLIRKRAVAQARTQSHLIEVLGGIQTVKAQHFELTARWKWQDRYRHFVTEGFKSVALGATSGEIGKFLNQLSGLLVLWVGMWLVLQGDFTLGMLIAFRIISNNVTGPLLQLSTLYQGYQQVQLSMERLSDIIDQNPELGQAGDAEQIALPSIQGAVRFEDVKFRFGDKGPYQVDRVSLSIETGSFVGVVGQSGSGKSTLMKLLPRLYEPQQGRIFIDDYDIAKVNLSSLRRQIGIVPQDSLLFEGTVAENIALNDPQASTESILDAAKIACAHDFIMGLGQGYATPLAERGSNLSGGQRQRIAIARTILANPQLLVMDEATSALDYNTERQLCLNLQNWAKGRTVLFITHRLSSIKTSDLILVMDQGRLVEQGSHEDLINANQRYAALYQQQGE
jgi:HlyB family type I secretion system ABC transporter